MIAGASAWEAFEAVARARPHAPALLFADQRIEFGALADDVDRCVAWLQGLGLGLRKGDVVALQLPKRRETYVLLLACLSLGVVYACLDPRNGVERSQAALRRLQPRLVVSDREVARSCAAALVLATPEQGRNWLSALPAATRRQRPQLEHTHPAYVMFTSGSTGEPKGAVIPHGGLMHLMAWGRRLFPDPARECFTGLNPLHFDNSVFDLYCGLLNGSALAPIDTAVTAPRAWLADIDRAGATVMFAVPTLYLMLDRLRMLDPSRLRSVRTFVFGGEAYPIDQLRPFFERFRGLARLVNVYGPTETSCICSSIVVDEAAVRAAGDGSVALGRLHPGHAHVIVADDGKPATLGKTGELWLGGPCVGLGYYGDPEQSERAFRQDPRQDAYRSTFYRTGDMVSEDAEGVLWFRGRSDNQVKVRGHRVELEEVDSALQAVAGVRQALTVMLEGPLGGELAVAVEVERPVGLDELTDACERRLPAYMRPTRIVRLQQLPVNANGKADRRAVAKLLASTKEPET